MVGWKRYLLLGVSGVGCIPVLDAFGMRDVLYFSVALSGMLAIGWGILVHRPRVPAPWLLVLLAVAAQITGALIQANTDASGAFGSAASLADAFLLAGHACMAAALWQFASGQHREFPRHGFLQGWILATSLVLIGWQFLFLPTIVQHGFSIDRPQTFRMAYPTMSYVEVGMLLWLWTSSEAHRSKAFALLAAATVLFACGESLFHGTSSSLGVPSNLNLVLWLLAYVAYGAAALHPDMKHLAAPRLSEESRHAKNVLALLLPMVLLLPVALLAIHFRDLHPATVGILVGFFLVMLLGGYELRLSIKSIVRTNRLLESQNRTDYLTGIPNRNHIEHVARTSVYQLDQRSGLLLMDIDGFKSINNTFGFHMGDLLIRAVADRIRGDSTMGGQHFARVDGDEFALLVLNVAHQRAIEAHAWRIHRLLEAPFDVNGVSIKVACSIGVAICHGFDSVDFAALLKDSERALGWARERQSQVEVYDKKKDVAEDKSWVLAEFRGAMAARQVAVYYQPKVHTGTRKVVGVEALVRWHHPDRGVVMPGEFMPKIETTDLAHRLFTLVLHDAAMQWHAWRAQGLVIAIALNVVARDIMSFDLVQEIRHVLDHSKMPADYLEIEITESSALSDPLHVKAVLSALMALGVKISIDDYGTGYSSLLYLQQWPLHFLKIDQQFIKQMRHHQSSATIVRSTMELARSLNVEVVAEGVEDAWVFHKLRSLGCYGVQGFLFSKAIHADSVVRVVREIEAAPVSVVEDES